MITIPLGVPISGLGEAMELNEYQKLDRSMRSEWGSGEMNGLAGRQMAVEREVGLYDRSG